MKNTKIANRQIKDFSFKKTLQLLRQSGIIILLLSFFQYAQAQKRTINLEEAIQLGLENSKQLKLSQSRVDEAISKYNQVKDQALPTAHSTFAYNHTEILNDQFQIGNEKPFDPPARTNAYIGTASVQQLIFQGNKLKFAKESTNLLTQIARLDINKDKRDITYTIINAYYNLYKVLQSEKVVEQNLQVIDRQIKQSERFFEQGLVTKNDVLRFQLEKSNIQLTGLDLENNRKVVNYNLDILLGLAEGTVLNISEIADDQFLISALPGYIDHALDNREELKQISLQTQVADYTIKSVKAERLPSFGVGSNLYFINPSGKFIPPVNQSLAPISIAATLSWNLGNLWINKNKVTEARIQKDEIEINEGILKDKIKTEVNQDYQSYLRSVERIKILQTSIAQAEENDKILESKYENTIASVTDRIDANNQLFQSRINLELAKADAMLAYYTLLKSTGTLK